MWVIILNSYQANHVSLIQNESYQQSPEKMKTNGEHERPYSHCCQIMMRIVSVSV